MVRPFCENARQSYMSQMGGRAQNLFLTQHRDASQNRQYRSLSLSPYASADDIHFLEKISKNCQLSTKATLLSSKNCCLAGSGRTKGRG